MNNNQIKNKRNIKRFIPTFMRKKTFAYSMLTVNILFITWVVVTETGLADELFLPGPLKIWQSFIEVSTEGYQGNTLFVHVYENVLVQLPLFLLPKMPSLCSFRESIFPLILEILLYILNYLSSY